jgi:regulator of cell morphogenesis and NO signaling
MIDPNSTVASIVLDHSECAAVLQRYRIDYCCRGEMSLAAACGARGVHPTELIGELEHAISERRELDHDMRTLSSSALIAHILLRYHAPLREALPFIRGLAAKVARVHGAHNPRLIELNETVAELSATLEEHIADEEANLFPAFASDDARRTLVGELPKSIRDEHAAVGTLLHRMRAQSEDYAVPDWACGSYRALFRELERLETDVLRHVHLENHVLLPRLQGDPQCA